MRPLAIESSLSERQREVEAMPRNVAAVAEQAAASRTTFAAGDRVMVRRELEGTRPGTVLWTGACSAAVVVMVAFDDGSEMKVEASRVTRKPVKGKR